MPSNRHVFWWFPALAVAWTCPASAQPLVIERIAAVVDARPIFLSAVRKRARPSVVELTRRGVPRWRQAPLIKGIYKRILQQLIDQRLIGLAAREQHITVTSAEVDRAVAAVARENRIGTDQLLARALEAGYTRAQYRALLRRELLERWLLQLYVSKLHHDFEKLGARARDQVVERDRARWLAGLRRKADIEVRLVL